jgi:thioredoxin reductase (NADPH)
MKGESVLPKEEKLIILGGACAGLTAAIYAARNNLDPLVVEGPEPGGQLATTTEVENYPGFPDAVQGPELTMAFRQQAERFDARIISGKATGIDLSSRPFAVNVGDDEYSARAVIIATGAHANLLGLEKESELMGHGVSTCATCDGPFFKGRKLLVIGGGDSAMEEGTFLTRFAEKVTIVHRRDELRASKIMQERAFDNPKIDFLWSHVLVDIVGDAEDGVKAGKVKDVKTDEVKEVECGGIFLAIGHTPNTAFVGDQIEKDKKGYILLQNACFRPDAVLSQTSVDGVFAAGDCVDSRYRQAVTAAGMGCMAALDAQRFLEADEDGGE